MGVGVVVGGLGGLGREFVGEIITDYYNDKTQRLTL